ncbi:MAG: triose-phosphate isomerase [Candidatus Margulisiibacteriota bacterium]
MRKLLLAGNWKMNKNIQESVALAAALKDKLKDITDKDILICPTFPALFEVYKTVKGSNVMLGAQNMYFEKSGAFTGEISSDMLKAAGCTHVILGHSERRQIFKETNEIVNKKTWRALAEALIPVVCIGETLAEREANQTLKVVETQVKGSLAGISAADILKVIIAYEPVWAIGTGKTATPAQAQEVHAFIRKILSDLYGKDVADQIRILYGGSVKPDNTKELMGQPDIDGALVGGASLKAEDFEKIVKDC